MSIEDEISASIRREEGESEVSKLRREVDSLRELHNQSVRLLNLLQEQVKLMSRIAACSWLGLQGPVLQPMPTEVKVPDGPPVVFVPGPMIKVNKIVTSGVLPPTGNGHMRIIPK